MVQFKRSSVYSIGQLNVYMWLVIDELQKGMKDLFHTDSFVAFLTIQLWEHSLSWCFLNLYRFLPLLIFHLIVIIYFLIYDDYGYWKFLSISSYLEGFLGASSFHFQKATLMLSIWKFMTSVEFVIESYFQSIQVFCTFQMSFLENTLNEKMMQQSYRYY